LCYVTIVAGEYELGQRVVQALIGKRVDCASNVRVEYNSVKLLADTARVLVNVKRQCLCLR
jgi:hypothetical protein